MGRRLILDTNVLIAYERGTIDRSSLDADELAIASVSVAEYRVGNELADSASRAADRARALAAIMSAVDVLDYTQATAAHHGRLLAHVRRAGTPRGAHDLIIAAHAAETGRTILSRDAKARFGNLPGVSAIDALFHRDPDIARRERLPTPVMSFGLFARSNLAACSRMASGTGSGSSPSPPGRSGGTRRRSSPTAAPPPRWLDISKSGTVLS